MFEAAYATFKHITLVYISFRLQLQKVHANILQVCVISFTAVCECTMSPPRFVISNKTLMSKMIYSSLVAELIVVLSSDFMQILLIVLRRKRVREGKMYIVLIKMKHHPSILTVGMGVQLKANENFKRFSYLSMKIGKVNLNINLISNINLPSNLLNLTSSLYEHTIYTHLSRS